MKKKRPSQRAKPNKGWDRQFSKAIGRFKRLSDVRDYILQISQKDFTRPWQHIAELALAASEGGDMSDLETCLKIMVAHGQGKARERK